MKPGTREFHEFIIGPFVKQIREAYEKLQILSEADLQGHASQLIQRFFQESGAPNGTFKVLTERYFKDPGIHPDIAVFKRSKPWVLLELKERRKLPERSARKEWQRLIEAGKVLRPKRGYLVYVARYGTGKVLRTPKGPGAHYFFEVPITLEQVWTSGRIAEWEEHFKKSSKFVAAK